MPENQHIFHFRFFKLNIYQYDIENKYFNDDMVSKL